MNYDVYLFELGWSDFDEIVFVCLSDSLNVVDSQSDLDCRKIKYMAYMFFYK